MQTLRELMDVLPQTGVVEWIGLRPAKQAPMERLEEAIGEADNGLLGDRYSKSAGKRQVTLIQAEHLETVASMLGLSAVAPEVVRRNIVVRGVNLLAFKNKRFHVGDALFEYTGLCHPCSRMERALGPGGYNALRGHGGITASIVKGGQIRVGSAVVVDPKSRR